MLGALTICFHRPAKFQLNVTQNHLNSTENLTSYSNDPLESKTRKHQKNKIIKVQLRPQKYRDNREKKVQIFIDQSSHDFCEKSGDYHLRQVDSSVSQC